MKLHAHRYSLLAVSLGLALLLRTAIAADPPATDSVLAPVSAPVQPSAAAPDAVRLLSVDVLQRYDRRRRQQIQDALRYVFESDPAYKAAYAETDRPLSDKVVGPITLSFITRFWIYYNLEPAGNVTDASVDALLQFASQLKRHPAWHADVVSPRFGLWIDQQKDKAELYRVRLEVDPVKLPPVLVRYHAAAGRLAANGVDVETEPLSVYWYGLTSADMKTLAAQPAFAPKLLEALQPMTELAPAKTGADFGDALRKALKNSGYDAAKEQLRIEPRAEYEDGYAITDEVLAELAKEPAMPPQIAAMLSDIVDMQFPRRSLFDAAAIERLRVGVGACLQNISAREKLRLGAKRLGDEDWTALLATLPSQEGKDQIPLGAQLQQLRDSGDCDLPDAAGTGPLAALYHRYSGLFDQLVRKAPVFDQSKPIQLVSGLCGCNTDNLKQQVYRFLPFWNAAPTQQIDFSLVSRIDYYGVTFNDSGELVMASDRRKINDLFMGEQAKHLDFITAARRHRVKVDWVIHRTSWNEWPALKDKVRQDIFNQLAINIVGLLETRMTGFPSTVLPWLSFGMTAVPKRGDGVTLYFDGYPADDTSVALFDDFIGDLRRRLTVGGFELNIMMRRGELSRHPGIYTYERLSKMVPPRPPPNESALYSWAKRNARRTFGQTPTEEENVQPRFLVLLDEPTTDSKKKLRQDVELATHGAERAALLRRIVPVLNFDGQDWDQLEDDLIYFNDNFGGVAFWPGIPETPGSGVKSAQPGVTHCTASRLVEDCLQDYFRDPPGEGASLACKFICENRWPLRFTLDLLALGLAIVGIVYARWCETRPTIDKYYLAPLAAGVLAIVIFVGLLVCDPYLAHLSSGAIIPGVLVLCMIGMYLYFRSMIKERDARP